MNTFERGIPYIEGKNQISIGFKSDENKKHYLMWSGGTDSTLLLYELLDAYGSDNVIAITLIFPWLIKDKVDNERLYRESFKSAMKLKGEKYSNFTHIEFNITINLLSEKNKARLSSKGGLAQASSWLLSIPLYIDDGSYVYEGNNRNDDLNLHMEDYLKAFEGSTNLIGKDITLREPYIYLYKHEILEKLIMYNIYDYTWYCETPKGIHKCNSCNPCKTHLIALNYLKCYAKNDYVRLKAEQILNIIHNEFNEENKKEVTELKD